MVDRRHGPDGHWNDAYPFVRLHGPSALYGVNSRRLGTDAIDQGGPNAGYYPRATAAEICGYYQRVLGEQLLPCGRVRFFGMSDYSAARNGPVFSAALTGYVEATRDGDTRKNLTCPANRYPDAAVDWIPLTCTAQRAEIIWATDPDLSAWMQRSRLNATCRMGDHQADPLMTSALARLFTNIEPAINKLETLMAGTGGGSAVR
jgi:hypothetical protein